MTSAKGAQIRSRAKYIADGEKSTKYFLSLEKKRQKFNKIEILKCDGKEYTNDQDLLNIAADFYDNLYKSCNVNGNDISNYLQKVSNISKLSDEQCASIEGKISLHEAEIAVKGLKNNKSPGIDGIPAEFYKKFWHKIGNIIINSFNESYEDCQLSESQRTSIISLIFKKGDARLLQNYRPISLTNCDYKILAFCLANRIQSVITHIINPRQVSYI